MIIPNIMGKSIQIPWFQQLNNDYFQGQTVNLPQATPQWNRPVDPPVDPLSVGAQISGLKGTGRTSSPTDLAIRSFGVTDLQVTLTLLVTNVFHAIDISIDDDETYGKCIQDVTWNMKPLEIYV